MWVDKTIKGSVFLVILKKSWIVMDVLFKLSKRLCGPLLRDHQYKQIKD